ncbi:MAG: hypothetical protein LBH05_08550 [Deferribacteraceae bacterium]|jgi:hypothetical protein|nr:hypothetical protein [Deferribacteraceae bacterium]
MDKTEENKNSKKQEKSLSAIIDRLDIYSEKGRECRDMVSILELCNCSRDTIIGYVTNFWYK